ncbi:MAG: PEP-CTERM sorting domain-containing protein [Alphaproteobacteria bacterium]|nr:PEP-CTERM sorting domain-containing protein [Alphaproteobacteria bacterium]
MRAGRHPPILHLDSGVSGCPRTRQLGGEMRALQTALLTLSATAAATAAQADAINILFVGNSFTHGRYDPVRTYNAGFGSGDVHDLLCPSAATCTEPQIQVDPAKNPPPGATLNDQLNYLSANPTARYNEPGPEGGLPGIFLQLTREAGLSYNVSVLAVSSATLTGYTTGTSRQYAGQIENASWNQLILQDQSFEPLPSTITVNGNSVATRGNFSQFQSGVNQIVSGVDAADSIAGKPFAKVTLYETQPLASYGYTSNNPAEPIYGSSTSPPGGLNAPYVGDADPIGAMASDLHNAYKTAAANEMAANPSGSQVAVALAGDAWVTAMNLGIAERNPYLVNEPATEVDLWDSDPLDACCTTPVGYHPSTYGAYLSALVLFDQITGVNPETLLEEFDPSNSSSAAAALGISPQIAQQLAAAAFETVQAGGPVPEPGSLALFGCALLGFCVFRLANLRQVQLSRWRAAAGVRPHKQTRA